LYESFDEMRKLEREETSWRIILKWILNRVGRQCSWHNVGPGSRLNKLMNLGVS
jgi:hypothetical protein